MATSRDDSRQLDPAGPSTTEPATLPTDQAARARRRTLRERFHRADRPFLLAAGLVISVLGVLASTLTVNGLSQGHAAQPISIPAPSATPTRQENPAKRQPKESEEPTRRPSPRESGVESQRGTGLIQNGTFNGSVTPWQRSPAAQFTLDNNQLKASVPPRATDNAPGGGQITSNSFSLQPAQTYTLRFDARASFPAEIVAIVQPQGGLPPTMLSQTTALNTSPQSFVFGFTAPANTAPPVVLRFQFTGNDKRSSATLDNVSIRLA